MQDPRQFDDIIEREQGLHRGLSNVQLSMIAIGGAIGTGLFFGSSFAIGFAGPSVLLSYAIGAFIALLLMGCLAEMTVTHPTSGSFGAYAEHYVGPWAGFTVRYAYWASIVLAVGTEVTAIATYMQYWFPGSPSWLWILVFSGGLIAVNVLSVKVFGAVEFWFSMTKIIAIVAFILLGAYVVFGAPADSAIGFGNYVSHGGFFPKGVWGMWVAVIVSIFSYLSIEMIAVAAAETSDPQTAISQAFRSTVLRLVLFYMLTLALMLAIVPWSMAGTDKSPFVKVMETIGIPGTASIINFVVLVAALSAMNSQLYITTRMMFSLSRAGHAPKRFGELNRHGVPVEALLLSSVGIAFATLINLFYPKQSFAVMMAVSMFGALFTWLMIFVTHYFFRRRRDAQGEPRSAFRMWGFPVLTLLGAVLILAILLTTYFTEAFRMTLVTGIPFLCVISVIYFLKYRQPGNVPVQKAS